MLAVFAVLGAVLILTAAEDDGPPLDDIVTEEGLVTKVPRGWIANADRPFEFGPPSVTDVFDQWTVARACPLDGCRARSLDEWIALADLLPTFDSVRDAEGDAVFNIEASDFDDARVLRARTEAGGQLVFVAAFADGASSYVACSVRVAIGTDEALTDAIVEVCRATVPVD